MEGGGVGVGQRTTLPGEATYTAVQLINLLAFFMSFKPFLTGSLHAFDRELVNGTLSHHDVYPLDKSVDDKQLPGQ